MNARNPRWVAAFATALTLAVSLPASAQSFASDDLKSIAHGTVTGEYRCEGTPDDGIDVRLVYTLTPPTERKSAVTALTVRGDDSNAASLAAIDAAIGSRNIEGVSVNCARSQVRIVLVVFGDGSSGLERVVLIKRKDAPVEVVES